MLRKATVADEGTYFCILEYYTSGHYTEYKGSMQIHIIGNVLNNNTLFDIILSILHTLKLT